MKKLFFSLYFCLTLISIAKPLSHSDDYMLKKNIVGYWSFSDAEHGVSMYGEYLYKSDGTKKGIMEICEMTQCIKEYFTSNWEIKNGYLISIIKSSNSEYLPIGKILKDRIIKIDEKEMILFSTYGEEKNIRLDKTKLF